MNYLRRRFSSGDIQVGELAALSKPSDSLMSFSIQLPISGLNKLNQKLSKFTADMPISDCWRVLQQSENPFLQEETNGSASYNPLRSKNIHTMYKTVSFCKEFLLYFKSLLSQLDPHVHCYRSHAAGGTHHGGDFCGFCHIAELDIYS